MALDDSDVASVSVEGGEGRVKACKTPALPWQWLIEEFTCTGKGELESLDCEEAPREGAGELVSPAVIRKESLRPGPGSCRGRK